MRRRLVKDYNIFSLIFILSVGIFLRIWGTNFGLPFEYQPDEPFFITPLEKLAVLHSPGWYGAPGLTVIYANGVIFLAVSKILSWSASIFEQYQNNPTPFLLAARIFYALVGTTNIYLVFILAKKIFKNENIALFSSLALALSVLHVEHSHYIRPDILLAFFLTLTALFSWNIQERGKTKDYILAAFFLALAMTTKYPGILGVIFILTGHILFWKDRRETKIINKKILLAGCIGVITFFVIFPYLIFDFHTVIKNILYEARSEHAGADQLGFFGNLFFYLQGMGWYIGTIPALFGVWGIIKIFQTNKKAFFFLLSFSLIFLCFIASLGLHWNRWAIPLLPFLSLFIGYGSAYALRVIRTYTKNTALLIAFSSCVLIFTWYPALLRSFRQSFALANFDTRDHARNWIIKNIPENTTIVQEEYTPILKNIFPNIIKIPTLGVKFPRTWAKKEGAGYAIASSFIYERVLSGPSEWQYQKDSYAQLFEKKNLAQHFFPNQSQQQKERIEKNDFSLIFSKNIFSWKFQAGPEIRIYKL